MLSFLTIWTLFDLLFVFVYELGWLIVLFYASNNKPICSVPISIKIDIVISLLLSCFSVAKTCCSLHNSITLPLICRCLHQVDESTYTNCESFSSFIIIHGRRTWIKRKNHTIIYSDIYFTQNNKYKLFIFVILIVFVHFSGIYKSFSRNASSFLIKIHQLVYIINRNSRSLLLCVL